MKIFFPRNTLSYVCKTIFNKLSKLLLSMLIIVSAICLKSSADQVSNSIGNDWMELLSTLESQVKVVEFDVKRESFTVNPDDKVKNAKPANSFSQTHILAEKGTGRFYKELKGIFPVLGEPDELRAGGESISFDGIASMQLFIYGKGIELENYYTPLGIISSESIKLPEFDYEESGLGLICLGFYMGKGILNVLETAEESKFVEKTNDLLEIHYLERRALSGKLYDHWRKIVLDLNKNGMIEEETRYLENQGNGNVVIYMTTSVKYEQEANGTWVPKSALKVFKGSKTKDFTKYIFNNFKTNHFSPGENIERFRIKFPNGTRVTDKLIGLEYVIGPPSIEDAISDSLKNTSSKMLQHEIQEKSKSENSSFTKTSRVELGKEAPTESEPAFAITNEKKIKDSRYKGLIIGVIFLLLVVMSYLVLRKKQKDKVLLLLLIGIIAATVLSESVYASAKTVSEPQKSNDWQIIGLGGKGIPASYCGLNCTLFALKFFDKTYSADLVKEALHPDVNGINLLRIKYVLEGYGLNTNALHLDSVNELKTIFLKKALVVIPSTVYEVGHYYVIVPAKREYGHNSYLLVDPGYSVEIEDAHKINERLAFAGGIVLVVSEFENVITQADQLKFEPEEIDFGKFLSSGNTPIKKEVFLTNIGGSAVMVTGISSSCSCSVAEWKGGLVEPKSKKKILISVTPNRWGIGKKKRRIIALCADSSNAQCLISGEGQLSDQMQGIRVFPNEIYFNINNFAREQDELTRKILISQLETVDSFSFQIDANKCPSWLRLTVTKQPTKGEAGEVLVVIDPDAIKTQTEEARFLVFVRKDKEPVEVIVHVNKNKSYKVSKAVLFVRDTESSWPQSVLFESYDPNNCNITIESTSTNPCLKTNCVNNSNGTSLLSISPSCEVLAKRFYTINVNVYCDMGKVYPETIHILVLDYETDSSKQ